MNGICTLANDYVYDQLVALLNSIEVIMGKDFPVCICPYDDRTEKIENLLKNRPQVHLFQDQNSLDAWDNFARTVWDTHPHAKELWTKAGSTGYHRFGTHRRFNGFTGPFERFLYMDADTLLLKDISPLFALLDDHDCIVYDFQHKDISHVYTVQSPKLTQVFPENRLKTEIFCSGFFASKRGFFPPEKRQWIIEQLKQGDAEILYPMSVDQSMINYMMMKTDARIYNLAFGLPPEERTGCCVTSPHFKEDNYLVYDKEKALTYLHYIGLPASLFTRLSQGENIDFPYRSTFLYYRFLHEQEKQPIFTGKAKPWNPKPTFSQKLVNKIKGLL